MNRWLVAGLVVVLGLSAALADGDPIKQRRDLMKANGDAAKAIVGMLKGAPFDLAAVKADLQSYANAAGQCGGEGAAPVSRGQQDRRHQCATCDLGKQG